MQDNPFVLLITKNFRVVLVPKLNYQPRRYEVMFEQRSKDAIGNERWINPSMTMELLLNEVFTEVYERYDPEGGEVRR